MLTVDVICTSHSKLIRVLTNYYIRKLKKELQLNVILLLSSNKRRTGLYNGERMITVYFMKPFC